MGAIEIFIVVGLIFFFGRIVSQNQAPPGSSTPGMRTGGPMNLLAVVLLLVTFGVGMAFVLYQMRMGQILPSPIPIPVSTVPAPQVPVITQTVITQTAESTPVLAYNASLTWIACCVILAIPPIIIFTFWRARSPRVPATPDSRSVLKLALIIGVLLLIAGSFVVTSATPHRFASHRQVGVTVDGTQIMMTDSNPIDSPAAVPTANSSPLNQYVTGTPTWGLLMLGLLGLGVIAGLWQVEQSVTRNTEQTSRHPETVTTGDDFVGEAIQSRLSWGWLVIPTLSLAGLIGQAAMLFNSPHPSKLEGRLVDFPQRQERMLKTVKEFIETQSKQNGGVPAATHWMVDATQDDIRSDRLVLVSGPYSTVQEAEEELIPLATDLVQRAFHEVHPWQGNWGVPTSMVRERAVEKEYIERQPKVIGRFTGDLYRVYMLVNLSPEVLRNFEGFWKASIVEHRLMGLGIFLGWITGQLLLGLIYFQFQGSNPRPGRWRWKLLATLVSLGLTAGAAAGLESLSRLI